MAADCGLITGLSYGCQRCSSCEQPGSRSLRPPPRRAPAERAGASRGLTAAPQDLKMVRGGLSNPPYSPVLSPIRPVLCPSDSLHSRFSPWQVDLRARKPARLPGMYARPDARERRRAHGKATAARRGAVGASQARFARLRLGSDSTAARRRGCGVPRAWSPQVQVDWYRSGGVLRRCQTLQERRGRVWRAPVVRSSA